jgi:hypothetical protein
MKFPSNDHPRPSTQIEGELNVFEGNAAIKWEDIVSVRSGTVVFREFFLINQVERSFSTLNCHTAKCPKENHVQSKGK